MRNRELLLLLEVEGVLEGAVVWIRDGKREREVGLYSTLKAYQLTSVCFVNKCSPLKRIAEPGNSAFVFCNGCLSAKKDALSIGPAELKACAQRHCRARPPLSLFDFLLRHIHRFIARPSYPSFFSIPLLLCVHIPEMLRRIIFSKRPSTPTRISSAHACFSCGALAPNLLERISSRLDTSSRGCGCGYGVACLFWTSWKRRSRGEGSVNRLCRILLE